MPLNKEINQSTKPFDVFEFHGQNEKKWGNHTANHDADLKYPPLDGIVFNGNFHEG